MAEERRCPSSPSRDPASPASPRGSVRSNGRAASQTQNDVWVKLRVSRDLEDHRSGEQTILVVETQDDGSERARGVAAGKDTTTQVK